MPEDIFTDEHLSPLNNGVGFNALRLAMTRTMAEEEALKRHYTQAGIRYVVTEVGGNPPGVKAHDAVFQGRVRQVEFFLGFQHGFPLQVIPLAAVEHKGLFQPV